MFERLMPRRRQSRAPLSRQKRHVMVADRAVPLTVTENRRSKRLTLRIEPGGRALALTVPPGLPPAEIEGFLQRQQGWLMTRLARVSLAGGLEDGGEIAIRGVRCVIRRTGSLRGLTRLTQETDERPVLEVGGAPEHLRRRIRDYLIREARADLTEAAHRHAARLGKPISSITLRDTRSRWGSCTSGGALSFSWRIVMAPPFVLDYLAAHEVAHLREMNHGASFWAVCEELCPETDRARRWLKRNGTMLHAVDFA